MWLDDLKKMRVLCTTKAGLVNINGNDLDRMVAIAERLRDRKFYPLSPYCAACGGEKMEPSDEWSHTHDCILYSDEYADGMMKTRVKPKPQSKPIGKRKERT